MIDKSTLSRLMKESDKVSRYFEISLKQWYKLANKATLEGLAWVANFGNLSTDDRLKGSDKGL